MVEMNFQNFLSAHPDLEAEFNRAANPRNVSKGNIIVGQGEADKDMFLLRKGHAKVVIYSEGGNEIHLAEFTEGTLFGEMAVLLEAARTSNVVALTDCALEIISAKDFNALMSNFPELALYMTQLLAKRLQETSQSLFENLAFTVAQRVYEFLMRHGVQSSKDVETFQVRPAPSVTSISENLNVSREATSRAVTKLISQGLVRKEKLYWDVIRPNF